MGATDFGAAARLPAGPPAASPDALLQALEGLFAPRKSLPFWLLYDVQGSSLFELITDLPEYYLTRTEWGILRMNAPDIARRVAGEGRVTVVELGAGTSAKTEIVLAALVGRQGTVDFYPVDLAPEPVALGRERMGQVLPQVQVHPLIGAYEDTLPALDAITGRKLVMFVGSSIGNYDALEAIAFLRELRAHLQAGDDLLLGTDLRKDPAMLLSAYDDSAGITAAFNLNVLARLNREAGAHFDLEQFRHVALWNPEQACVEMHLESTTDQMVRIDALNRMVRLRAGERIHTESSHKFDEAGIRTLLAGARVAVTRSYTDEDGLFAVHLARAERDKPRR